MTRTHGGPGAHGSAAHDFSTNANSCGPCPPVLEALRSADAQRYPDPAYTELRERLAALHGVPSWRVCLAGSGSEFIFRITAWAAKRGARRVALPAHGFGDYGAAAQAWGLHAGPAGQAQLAWSCDPSSPLGQSDPGWPLAPGHPAIRVLDRAYDPLRLSGFSAWQGPALDLAWQLWTPNKALGLTGVRAAYAIAPQDARSAAAELDSLAPSWVIGAHGVALLRAWCEPETQHWLLSTHATLRTWKQAQASLCRELGLQVLPSETNFFTVRLPVAGAAERLRAQGVQVRDCASFGLPGHARLAVLPPHSQAALAHAWRTLA